MTQLEKIDDGLNLEEYNNPEINNEKLQKFHAKKTKILFTTSKNTTSPNTNDNQQENHKKKEHLRKQTITFLFALIMHFLNKIIRKMNETRNDNNKINEIKQIKGDQAKKINIKIFQNLLLNKNIKDFLCVEISTKGKKFETIEENLNYHKEIFEKIDASNDEDLKEFCNISLYNIIKYCTKKISANKEIFKGLKKEYDEMIKNYIKKDSNCFEEYLENIDSDLEEINNKLIKREEKEKEKENLNNRSETVFSISNVNGNNNVDNCGPSPVDFDFDRFVRENINLECVE